MTDLADTLRPFIDGVLGCAPPHRAVIASDADGTIWRGDIGDDLFIEALTRHPVGPVAREDLQRHARELLGSSAPSSLPDLAHAFVDAYRAGHIDIVRICELQACALGDRSVAELDALVDVVAGAARERVRPDVRALFDLAARAGVAVHVVSGSLGLAVARTLDAAGVAYASVSGAELAVDDAHVRAALAGPIPLHAGKVRALEAVGAWPPALGLGDGGWDAPFLQGCEAALLVHPAPALARAMAGHPRLLVLRDGTVAALEPPLENVR